MIISIEAGKATYKIEHRFISKTLTTMAIERTYLNIMMAEDDNPTTNTQFHG